MRLAKASGVDAEPIPACFLSTHFYASPNLVVPSGENLGVTARLVKEFLAQIVDR